LVSGGVCPESVWPYNVAWFDVKPTAGGYGAATKFEVLDYQRVDNTVQEDLLEALAIGPVVGGFTVYESFESTEVARSGIVPMPRDSESVVGGHAILVTGYDQVRGVFRVRNSWGTGWGQKGYCEVPFAYFTNGDLADDFWLIRRIS
jgi:C1A family cysteine protease